MNGTNTGASPNAQWFVFQANSTSAYGADTWPTTCSNGVSNVRAICINWQSGSVSGVGFTYSYTLPVNRVWYKFVLSESASILTIQVFNGAGVLQNTQSTLITDISGYDRIAISATSSAACAPTCNLVAKFDNVVASSTSPTTQTSISWDATTYTIGDNPTFSWSISNIDWDTFESYYIVFEKNGIQQDFTFELACLCSSRLYISQQGTYQVLGDEVGTYTVKLYKTTLLGVGASELISTASTAVRAESSSYIFPENNVNFMRVPFNVTYTIGYSLVGYTSEISIIGTNSETGGIVEVSIIDASTGNTGTQIMQQFGVVVWPEGRYTLKLYDARKDLVLDTKYITIVNDPRQIPVMLFNTSNISTDRLTYFINDYMYVDFTIADTEFRNYTIRSDVYNFNTSQKTKQFFNAFTEQTGSFETLVNSKINMQCERGVYCWFEPGLNQIQLVRYNDTFSSVIASQNFTVASTTVDGWGLSLSSQNINTTDTLTIKVIVPPGQTGRLQIRDPGYSTNATKIYIIENIGEGTQTYKTTITRVGLNGIGYYEAEIIDQSNNVVKMHLPITVTKSTGVGITPGGGTVNTNTALTIISVFSLIAFWGLLIWLGIVGTVIATMAQSQSGVNGMAVIVVAWFSAVFIALIGMFDPYKIYVIVISTIISAILFRLGRSTTVEE